jgi:hypothetical protein
VVSLGDLQLVPELIEPVHLASRDHAGFQAVADRRFVQLEHLPSGIVLRTRSDRVDQKGFAQVPWRRGVGPLPVRHQPACQRLFGKRRLPPPQAAH